MALPRWTTPEGNLGIVPEQQYYDLELQAEDPSGGNLVYTHVSGELPLGIQVARAGRLQGVPVSEAGGLENVEYIFTIRVKNEIEFTGSISGTTLTVTAVTVGALDIGQTLERTGILPRTRIVSFISGTGGAGTYKISQPQSMVSGEFVATSGLSDRTFRLTVTNIAPPLIYFPEKDSFIGLFLDGSEIDIFLEALEFTPGIELKWQITQGDLPTGLSLSESGRITGFIYPIISTDPGTTPGWDASVWSMRGWDFPIVAISKTFRFTVQVSDGIKYDQSTYTLLVFPRASLTADSDILTVDLVQLGTNETPLTIDAGTKHAPIITTKQIEIVPARQSSFYSFNLEAIDLDNDVVNWTFTNASSGAFDEQDVIGAGYNYIAVKPIGGRLRAGLFPKTLITTVGGLATITYDYTNVNLLPNDDVKVLNGSNIFEVATVDDTTTIRLTGNIIPSGSVGNFITQISSGANATISAIGATTGNITLAGNVIYGNITTELQTYQITTAANLTANIGDYVSQISTGANAVITSTPGYISFASNVDLTNIQEGDIITQPSTGANASVLRTPDFIYNSNVFYVNYVNSTSFNLGSGNVTFTRGANVTTVNNYPTASNVTANTFNILQTVRQFATGSGNISINGTEYPVTLSSFIKDAQTRTLSANIGDIITQTGNIGYAVVTEDVSDVVTIPVIIVNPSFNAYSGNLIINGANANVWIKQVTSNSFPYVTSATVGTYITQPSTGANARITANVVAGQIFSVEFLGNNFTTGSGNLQFNGSNVTAYPSQVICQTDITSQYNSAATFDINFALSTGQALINGSPTFANVTQLVDVGVTFTGLVDEGTTGFDEGRYDQGELKLPAGISINTKTGWITGRLPSQTVNSVDYQFEVIAFKRDLPSYRDVQIFTLTILGDINNRIDWLTPPNLGSLQNGKISDLKVEAVHITNRTPKTLLFNMKPSGRKKLPQGLNLLSTGLIVGRVSFQIFLLDGGDTTIDNRRTTFDETYTFDVEVRDVERTISAQRTFTIRVIGANETPYENLYLKALPTLEQRNILSGLLQETSIFPPDLIYRKEDPWFGLAKNLRILFVPGMDPSSLGDYTLAADTNHFRKKLQFGEVRTARALDLDFNTKYEVVYVEIFDENTNEFNQGPQNAIDLSSKITTPYYDKNGNAFTTVYPNAFSNMQNRMAQEIGYANKGALPDWMTSRQTNGRVLGFTRALVLAYCEPGAAAAVAYRVRESEFDFNQLDFTVDRYNLDNVYSTYYNLSTGQFEISLETTFDRYPTLSSTLNDAGIVDYAVSSAFELINYQLVDNIKASPTDGGLNGLDGVRNFKDGDLIVFAEQEFIINGFDAEYNAGWSQVTSIWDFESWDFDEDTGDSEPGEGWNASLYVPGFVENNADPTVTNRRIGVWKVNIVNDVVILTFVKAINYFDKLYVRNGKTYGGTNIFYDPVVKEDKNYANYTLIRQEIRTSYTTFDGNSTRFYDNRDGQVVPEEGDKYIKFTKTGVFT